MNKIDINKQYRTRDGRAARILCIDRAGNHPVVALAGEDVLSLSPEGRFAGSVEHPWDLLEVREPKTIWVNEYPSGYCHAHGNPRSATLKAFNGCATRTAVKYVEVIED